MFPISGKNDMYMYMQLFEAVIQLWKMNADHQSTQAVKSVLANRNRDKMMHVNVKYISVYFSLIVSFLTADFKKHSSVVWPRALLQINLVHVLESMKTWTCGKLIQTRQELLLCNDKLESIWKVGFK